MSGIATGSIYGLAGTGLVLTYKTSGIFNFGYGAIATAAAYFFYFLHVDKGLDWKLSFALAVFVAGPLMGLGMERIARRLAPQRTATKIVGTVGLILFVQGLGTIKYGSDTIRVQQFLPRAFESFRFGGVNVLYPQLWVTIVAVVGVLLLFGLFRFTRTGLAMRAVVDDPDLVAMQAVNPVRVRRIAWTIGTTFAALSGVLVLPFIGLNAIGLTFSGGPGLRGRGVGCVLQHPAHVRRRVGARGRGGSVHEVHPGRELAFRAAGEPAVHRAVRRAAGDTQTKTAVAVGGRAASAAGVPRTAEGPAGHRHRRLRVARAVPQLAGDNLGFYTIGLTQMIILLSLGLLVRTSGQVSLCHSVFAAIGAVVFSQLAVDHGVPWLLATVPGALIVVPVGAVVAIPSIRLSGLFLALATFGFGILVEQLLYARGFMFTVLANGRSMPRPSFAQGDTAYYYVVLAFVLVTALVMVAVHASRLGRILRGLADAPVAVATMGLSTNVTRVIVFCISAFFAGIGGILYGSSVHFATSGDTNYSAFYSLVLLAILALAPFGEPWYAIVIGITSVIPAYITGAHTRDWLNVIFGSLRAGVDAGWPAARCPSG